MGVLTGPDLAFAQAVSQLTFCNPFTPERIGFERDALGEGFVDSPIVWSLQPEVEGERANLRRLVERAEPLASRLRERLAAGATASATELALYEDLAVYLLFQRWRDELERTIAAGAGAAAGRVAYWGRYLADFERHLRIPGAILPAAYDPAHLFACFFQIRRAFTHIFGGIVGGSMPAARLRASVWQSIFTHDLRRYARVLYRHMGDMTTLVTGPSGTGKEIVARAIAQSRYIPFDPETRQFAGDFTRSFFPLNLSALSPTLIESELFGHKRGSYTGAVADRAGWLEVCPALGTVFLDEVGELDASIQVKLLRVLQARTFQRLGETQDRSFPGKIIAATNRDPAMELESGRMRRDFYYRLCSDNVATPPLREQLADCPDDLRTLVLFIGRRIVGEEAESVTAEVVEWIERHLGRDYPWPGNIRELEQCVRNIVIRRRYDPPVAPASDERGRFAAEVASGSLGAEDLLRRYCTLVYADSGSYEEAARRLGLDRRTVRARVDRAWLGRLRGLCPGAAGQSPGGAA
jgi:hypothetical protein